MLCELVDKTADEFFMFPPLQSAQSGSGVMDGCDGSQLYPPTAPIMLQVNPMTPLGLHHLAEDDTRIPECYWSLL